MKHLQFNSFAFERLDIIIIWIAPISKQQSVIKTRQDSIVNSGPAHSQ